MMQTNTIEYKTLHYKTIHDKTTQNDKTHYNAIHGHTRQYNILYNTIQHNIFEMEFNTIQRRALEYTITLFKITQYNIL